MERREVVFVDGVRTAFGRAGPQGIFWKTRADDMAVKVVRELLRRNPEIPPERIGDVIYAATAQVGDQGLTLGRDVALLAGHPAVRSRLRGRPHVRRRAHRRHRRRRRDRVRRLRHRPRRRRRAHGPPPDGRGRRLQSALRRPSVSSTPHAVTMGATAENLHDRFPQITKDDADAFAVQLAAARGGRVVERRHARDRRADERLHRRRLEARRARRVPQAGHHARGARLVAHAVPGRRPRHRRELRRADRRRHRLLSRRRGDRRRARARAEDATGRLRLCGRRAGADGHRADSGDRARARASRPDARRRRPLRAERALRRSGAHLVRRPGRRSRGRAPQPVRRRDRLRASARSDGREA